MVKGTYIQN
jgi:hypothetical protein